MNRRIRRNQVRRGELHADAVGNVRKLRRELRRNFRGHRAVRPEQRQIFAVGTQLEICVQRRAGRGAVLAGSKDDHEAFRRHVRGRETPFARIARAVRQGPVEQADAVARRVLDFNPVGRISVLVGERIGVARHEFGDADLAAGGEADKKGSQQKSGQETTRFIHLRK